jgi:hypothetical protein
VKGQDAAVYRIMSSLKRKFEEMEDMMMIAENAFNSSVSAERKYRLVCRISTDVHEKLERQYGSPSAACTCNDEGL